MYVESISETSCVMCVSALPGTLKAIRPVWEAEGILLQAVDPRHQDLKIVIQYCIRNQNLKIFFQSTGSGSKVFLSIYGIRI